MKVQKGRGVIATFPGHAVRFGEDAPRAFTAAQQAVSYLAAMRGAGGRGPSDRFRSRHRAGPGEGRSLTNVDRGPAGALRADG